MATDEEQRAAAFRDQLARRAAGRAAQRAALAGATAAADALMSAWRPATEFLGERRSDRTRRPPLHRGRRRRDLPGRTV